MTNLPYPLDYIEKLQEKIKENIKVITGDTTPTVRIETEQELYKNIFYYFMIVEKNQVYIARKLNTIQETAKDLKLNI